MSETVPDAYRQELANRWDAYWLAPDGSSLKTTAEKVLGITLDKCSRALDRPTTPRPTVVHENGVLADPPSLEYGG
jgi:hypothetical protein